MNPIIPPDNVNIQTQPESLRNRPVRENRKRPAHFGFNQCHQCKKTESFDDLIRCQKQDCFILFCFNCIRKNKMKKVPEYSSYSVFPKTEFQKLKESKLFVCLCCKGQCMCKDCNENSLLDDIQKLKQDIVQDHPVNTKSSGEQQPHSLLIQQQQSSKVILSIKDFKNKPQAQQETQKFYSPLTIGNKILISVSKTSPNKQNSQITNEVASSEQKGEQQKLKGLKNQQLSSNQKAERIVPDLSQKDLEDDKQASNSKLRISRAIKIVESQSTRETSIQQEGQLQNKIVPLKQSQNIQNKCQKTNQKKEFTLKSSFSKHFQQEKNSAEIDKKTQNKKKGVDHHFQSKKSKHQLDDQDSEEDEDLSSEDNDEDYKIGSDIDSTISNCLNYDKIKDSLMLNNANQDITKSYVKIELNQKIQDKSQKASNESSSKSNPQINNPTQVNIQQSIQIGPHHTINSVNLIQYCGNDLLKQNSQPHFLFNCQNNNQSPNPLEKTNLKRKKSVENQELLQQQQIDQKDLQPMPDEQMAFLQQQLLQQSMQNQYLMSMSPQQQQYMNMYQDPSYAMMDPYYLSQLQQLNQLQQYYSAAINQAQQPQMNYNMTDVNQLMLLNEYMSRINQNGDNQLLGMIDPQTRGYDLDSIYQMQYAQQVLQQDLLSKLPQNKINEQNIQDNQNLKVVNEGDFILNNYNIKNLQQNINNKQNDQINSTKDNTGQDKKVNKELEQIDSKQILPSIKTVINASTENNINSDYMLLQNLQKQHLDQYYSNELNPLDQMNMALFNNPILNKLKEQQEYEEQQKQLFQLQQLQALQNMTQNGGYQQINPFMAMPQLEQNQNNIYNLLAMMNNQEQQQNIFSIPQNLDQKQIQQKESLQQQCDKQIKKE